MEVFFLPFYFVRHISGVADGIFSCGCNLKQVKKALRWVSQRAPRSS